MNIVDVIVILLIAMCGVIGMKKGFIKSLVSLVGIILVFVLAYYLKNPIAEWLSLNLPFFNFTGSFKGATILNVIIYQLIAFFIVFAILMALYSILIIVSKVIEWFLKITIILAIPSKIGGFIVGLFEGIVIALMIIMILSLPTLNLGIVEDSAIRNYLYNASPIMGNITGNTNDAIEEIIDLRDKFEDSDDKEEFNLSCLDILLKHKVITISYTEKLINSDKLKIDKAKAQLIVDKYK